MRPPSDLPMELGHHFSCDAAVSVGVSRRRLRGGDLDSRFRGSRSVPVATRHTDEFARLHHALVQRCLAFIPVAPAEFCFSHGTAATLYGIPLPLRLRRDLRIDVSVPVARPQPRASGVRGHRLNLWEVRVFRGMPLVAPAVAWAQVANVLTLDELVIAGDYLVQRKHPKSSPDDLVAAASVPRRGARQARRALLDVRVGTDSPPESELRLVLVRAGLPEPLIGHTVIHEGYFVGTPDLAYVEQKVAIEYQGSGHWLDRDVFEDDIIRRELFERAGWKVILVTAPRLRQPAQLAAEVAAVLRERAV
ncbi:hypothetical protein QMG83_11945 [Salinibacterium sp. G-O1]|uniref:hypothetical protein n=1 Tax=Salinibacterium sp. G-O1 TaxID=3046208 RepID=UPI0024BADD4F|nr:hypothetical protein [Salinibacterium sp. G-O1]MDJ0335938.1 hypothetical protein [Salinibacterium sp. G-O1]